MASTITNYSNNINITFPTPGISNNSEGFRNNFSAIKNALAVANGEISVIQQQSVTGIDWSTLTPNIPISIFQNDAGYVSTTSVYWANLSGALNSQSQISDIVNDNPLDSIVTTAKPISDNIIQLTTTSLATHYTVGQTLRIFGAAVSDTFNVSGSGVINSTVLTGFYGTPGSDVFRYKVAQFDFSTGELSAASVETAVSGITLSQFNLENNVSLSITRTNTNYGILLYRKSPSSASYNLIATLGSKDFEGGLSARFVDYYDFDYTAWSKKSSITNDYQSTTGLVHMPLTAPTVASKGWISAVITAVDIISGVITLDSSLYMNQIITISHDDTQLLQTAINTRSTNNLNSLRLGNKTYVISHITLPAGFKLYGSSRRASLKKLSWSSNDQTTNKMLATSNNAVLNLISIANIDIDGNMQNQFLLGDFADPYINYCVDIKGLNHSFDNLIISNVIGGGISSTQPINLMITNCHIESGGLSDRDEFSPIMANDGSNIMITNNVIKNFPSNLDVSLSNSGVVSGNIVSNCGSGILIYGSIHLLSSSNVILGPAGEFISGPDILNSAYDAVNIVLESDCDFLSDTYVYQEDGSNFNLVSNSGLVSYKVEKLRKVNNVEELYGEVTIQDPTTSTATPICPLFPIINTELTQGQFKFLITTAGINSLTNYYSYSNLHAIDPNHVGLVYKALLTEYKSIGKVTNITLYSSSGGVGVSFVDITVPTAENLSIGSTVRFNDLSGSSPDLNLLDGIICAADIPNTKYTIMYDNNITQIGAVVDTTQLVRKNTFVLAKGRIS